MDANANLDHSTKIFLQQIQAELQKTKMTEQVATLANRCWDVCLGDSRPPSKMDGKTSTCLDNCVNRMVDASVFLAEHIQKLGGQAGSGFS